MKLKEILNYPVRWILRKIAKLDDDKQDVALAALTILIYFAVVAIFLKIGGFVAGLATKQVPLLSVDGIIKLGAIVFLIGLVSFVFIFGPLMIVASTSKWTTT